MKGSLPSMTAATAAPASMTSLADSGSNCHVKPSPSMVRRYPSAEVFTRETAVSRIIRDTSTSAMTVLG